MKIQNAEFINPAMDNLPVANSYKIEAFLENDNKEKYNAQELENFQAVQVINSNCETRFVNCPTQQYKIVQHKDAFRPIIEGLTVAGCNDFKFRVVSDFKKAKLHLFVDELQGNEGIRVGFDMVNSYDGSTGINFGFSIDELKKTVELVGWRQVCSNGMKVRVDLNDAQFVTLEEKEKLKNLAAGAKSIRHTESAIKRLEAVKLTVEAIAVLREPMERIINAAKKRNLPAYPEQIRELMHYYVGKILTNRVEEEFNKSLKENREERTLWGLFNAITHVGSHCEELKEATRELLIDKASNFLHAELIAPLQVEAPDNTQTKIGGAE